MQATERPVRKIKFKIFFFKKVTLAALLPKY